MIGKVNKNVRKTLMQISWNIITDSYSHDDGGYNEFDANRYLNDDEGLTESDGNRYLNDNVNFIEFDGNRYFIDDSLKQNGDLLIGYLNQMVEYNYNLKLIAYSAKMIGVNIYESVIAYEQFREKLENDQQLKRQMEDKLLINPEEANIDYRMLYLRELLQKYRILLEFIELNTISLISNYIDLNKIMEIYKKYLEILQDIVDAYNNYLIDNGPKGYKSPRLRDMPKNTRNVFNLEDFADPIIAFNEEIFDIEDKIKKLNNLKAEIDNYLKGFTGNDSKIAEMWIRDDMSVSDIAKELNMAPETVENKIMLLKKIF